jgi:hypothetical protein
MTMHLTRHTTIGKKRAKFKWASAEQKRLAEQLDREWTELKQRHTTDTKSNKKSNTMRKYKLEIPAGRGTSHIPSKTTGVGVAVKNDIPVYTGTSMVGITIMHKSCLQPVFNQQEAIDAANMRRG